MFEMISKLCRSRSWMFEIFSKLWRSKSWMSKSWMSKQVQDWAQIMVFEMVHLLFQKVFAKKHDYKGNADTQPMRPAYWLLGRGRARKDPTLRSQGQALPTPSHSLLYVVHSAQRNRTQRKAKERKGKQAGTSGTWGSWNGRGEGRKGKERNKAKRKRKKRK